MNCKPEGNKPKHSNRDYKEFPIIEIVTLACVHYISHCKESAFPLLIDAREINTVPVKKAKSEGVLRLPVQPAYLLFFCTSVIHSLSSASEINCGVISNAMYT